MKDMEPVFRVLSDSIRSIPLDLLHERDGQTLLRIVLPLAIPGLMVVALVSFLMSWNEFFFAITFIQSDNLKPVTISFLAFQGRFDTNWGLTSAAGIIVILPVVVLFLALQRRFISGLTAGALKG